MRKYVKIEKSNVDRVDQTIDRFVGIRVLKGLPQFIFSLVSYNSLRALPFQ